MLIKVKAFPSSKKEKIEEVGPDSLEVSVKADPSRGEANKRIVQLLSIHFRTTAGNVRMVKGARSRNKIFDINA